MSDFLAFCHHVRACWDELFHSRYVDFLEAENTRLRIKIERLELTARPVVAAAVTEEKKKKYDLAPFAVNTMPRTWQDIKVSVRSREFPEPKPEEAPAAKEN
jgi:hypothetical protein